MSNKQDPATVNKRQTQKAREELLLENDLEMLEKELSEKYLQLGKSVYELSERRVDEIDKLVNRLVAAKVKLAQAKGQCACVYCLAQNPLENRYCGSCGRELEQEG